MTAGSHTSPIGRGGSLPSSARSSRHLIRKASSYFSRIAFIGDCDSPAAAGIATFTTGYRRRLHFGPEVSQNEMHRRDSVNDPSERLRLPRRTRALWDRRRKRSPSYSRASEFLNINNVSRCFPVQREFRNLRRACGSHLLTPPRGVRMPIVTTLHTVLQDPNEDQRYVMEELDQLSGQRFITVQRPIVGGKLLENVCGSLFPREKSILSRMA